MLPEHDVVVFDETHQLEEVMTSALGVEITPGRLRALVASARPLVRETDADHLARLASAGDELGLLLADRVGTRVLHQQAEPPVDDRPMADLLARCAELTGRVADALRRGDGTPSLLSGDGGSPERASRKTRAVGAAGHLVDDLHRLLGRRDGEVAWVDGTRRAPGSGSPPSTWARRWPPPCGARSRPS